MAESAATPMISVTASSNVLIRKIRSTRPPTTSAGTTIRKAYRFTGGVGDDNGGTDTETVTITITGTNDAPKINPVADTILTEPTGTGNLTQYVDLTFTDTDLTETGHTATITGVSAGGSLSGKSSSLNLHAMVG